MNDSQGNAVDQKYERKKSGHDGEETQSENPPDGGWGWIVTLSAFSINFIIDGIIQSFGVFLSDYVEVFDSNVANVSLSNSLLVGILQISGPVVAAFISKWGCRKVGIVGSLMSAGAFLLCSFSPNIYMFLLMYGVVGGLGFGMLYFPGLVLVGLYFERKRPIALGIAVCGSSLGAFAIAPLAEMLQVSMHWRDCLIVFAGLLLQGCIFSALMRPLTARRRVTANTRPSKANEKVGDEPSHSNKLLKKELRTTANRRLTQSADVLIVSTKHGDVKERMHCSEHALTTVGLNESRLTLHKQNLFFSGSLYISPPSKGTVGLVSTSTSKVCSDRLNCLNALPKPIADILAEMLDLHVLKNRAMMVLCLGNFFGMLGFYIPIIFSSDRAVQYGVSEDNAAFLLSIMGICNMVGRVLSGLMVVFIPKLSPLLVNNISIFLAGLAVLFTPFCYTFPTMALAIGAYGLFAATIVSMAPIIICGLFGSSKLANGFGLINLVRGITAIAGPPLAGMLYDHTGGYNITFYAGGAALLFAAAVQSLLFLESFQPRNAEIRDTQVE